MSIYIINEFKINILACIGVRDNHFYLYNGDNQNCLETTDLEISS